MGLGGARRAHMASDSGLPSSGLQRLTSQRDEPFPQVAQHTVRCTPKYAGLPPRSLHEAGPSGFLTQASMRDGETQDVLHPAPDTAFNFHEPVLSVSLQGLGTLSVLQEYLNPLRH